MAKKYKNDRVIVDAANGKIIEREYTKGKNKGMTYLRLEWNPGFTERFQAQNSSAQKYLDSEVLRLSAPYMPIRTGILIKSGQLGTRIGTGLVQWVAPYARPQYYKTKDTRSYDTKRGGHWFERMKAEHGKALIAKTRAIAGGKEGKN